jgi:hypothetical protein
MNGGTPGGRTAFCTSEGYQVHKQSLSSLWKIQSLCYWEKISQMMARKGGGPSSLDTSASVLHGEDTAASLTRGGMDMPNKNVQFTSRAGKDTPGLMDRGSPKRIRRPHPPRSSPGELSEGGGGTGMSTPGVDCPARRGDPLDSPLGPDEDCLHTHFIHGQFQSILYLGGSAFRRAYILVSWMTRTCRRHSRKHPPWKLSIEVCFLCRVLGRPWTDPTLPRVFTQPFSHRGTDRFPYK